jgi:hypothetical protein
MIAPRAVSNARRALPMATAPSLGVLSIHLDGAPCRVGCEFCYLGAREGANHPALDPALLEEVIARLDYAEVAVALSEPIAPALPSLRAIVRGAAARGRPVAVTTTAAVLGKHREVVEGIARVNLSVDPRKGAVAPPAIERLAASLAAPGRELVLIVTLASAPFAGALLGGTLRALVELPSVDKVALNALKPPPRWCDRAFWMRACAQLAQLLAEHLDRRLFLDCYVAARLLRLGGCPARPDLSPGNEFRACVYQPAPDFRFRDADDLAARLGGFSAPAACPFPVE